MTLPAANQGSNCGAINGVGDEFNGYMAQVKLVLVIFLFIGILKVSANDGVQYKFDNTDTVVLLPRGVAVEKSDTSVFCVYTFKSSKKIILSAYVGMAPGFPSKYAVSVGAQQIQKCEINKIHARSVRWKDENGKYNEEDLLAIPYGAGIGFLHFGSIGQDKDANEKAIRIILSAEVLVPHKDPRSGYGRTWARIKRTASSVFGISWAKEKNVYQFQGLYDEVQYLLESTGAYPS
ncbi:MAG: hypothetical protein PHV33_03520 [Elusimicrobiales bacterium]|nr:hypothetical protein [Elusimicrobiales bacterium]